LIQLKVIKTDPEGIVIVNQDTDLEIVSDPIDQTLTEFTLNDSPDSNSSDVFWKNNLFLEDEDWKKINSLLELGLFNNLSEAITFFLHEGIKERSDILEKSASITEQIKKLKENVKKTNER